MKKAWKTWMTWAALAIAVAAIAVACTSSGTATCKETCETTDDCASGLTCLSTSTKGKICLPNDCNTCFDNQKSCDYSENLDAQANGEARVCTFSECL